MSLPDDIHFINCTHENLPSSIFTDYQLKMRMELMRRRGQQKRNPEKLGCNIVPKLFCWLPKLYYRGVSLEFLDYVLSTEEIDPATGKYEDSKHEASVLALLNGGVSHLIGSPASGVDDRASESSSEGAVVGEDGAQEDGAQHIPDAGAPPTSGAEASSGQ